MTDKQIKELMRLVPKEMKDGEERAKKERLIDSFRKVSSPIIEGWNKIFTSYPAMLQNTPDVFPNPQKVADVINNIMPSATELIDELIGFTKDMDMYNVSVTAYMKDQADIVNEIAHEVNVDKNLFTMNANQVMRLPELNKELNELLEDCQFLKKDMNVIEKKIASIRINPN